MIDASKLAEEDASPAASGATSSATRLFRRYLLSLSTGVLGALGLFWLALFWLERTENLPPPAFSNNLCVDEKLDFLRSNPIASPNLLVIGSSVAWRHVDGDALVREIPDANPLNGAFCGLFANQAVYVANWLLDREPSIRHVVMVADPQDFTGCWRVPDAVFSRSDADAYLAEQATPWGYYMRYFSPRSLVRNALTIKDQRAGRSEWDPLVFNRYGDGPLVTDDSRPLLYGQPEALDRNCFNALATLSQRLEREGRRFTMVATPLHPQWKERYDRRAASSPTSTTASSPAWAMVARTTGTPTRNGLRLWAPSSTPCTCAGLQPSSSPMPWRVGCATRSTSRWHRQAPKPRPHDDRLQINATKRKSSRKRHAVHRIRPTVAG